MARRLLLRHSGGHWQKKKQIMRINPLRERCLNSDDKKPLRRAGFWADAGNHVIVEVSPYGSIEVQKKRLNWAREHRISSVATLQGSREKDPFFQRCIDAMMPKRASRLGMERYWRDSRFKGPFFQINMELMEKAFQAHSAFLERCKQTGLELHPKEVVCRPVTAFTRGKWGAYDPR